MNTLSVADVVPKIQNPYNLRGERYVGYGGEEYQRMKTFNPDLIELDIDYIKGGRYLASSFDGPLKEKDMKKGGIVELDNGERIGVLNTDHFLVMNGKKYRIVNLESGTRILLDGMMGRGDTNNNVAWHFKKLTGEDAYLDIWSNKFRVGGDVKGDMYGWNAKFYNGTFGIVEEFGHKEMFVPLMSGPKNVDRILGVTKIKGNVREIEALIGDASGIPIGIARVQRDTLKFVQLLQEIV